MAHNLMLARIPWSSLGILIIVGSLCKLGVRRSNAPEARLWIVGVWHSIRHVHQTSSRRDADASKQVGEPGIGAKGVPERLYFEVSETIEPLLVSLF